MTKFNLSIRDIRFHVQGMEFVGMGDDFSAVAELDIQMDSYMREITCVLEQENNFGSRFAF